MSSRPLRTSTLEQRKAADAAVSALQGAQQRPSARDVSKRDASKSRSTKKRTRGGDQPEEGMQANTGDALMQVEEQQEGGQASDSAALRKQLGELAQLVRQQADEHQRESEQQRALIA